MKTQALFFLRLFLFWLMLFAFERLLFIFHFFGEFSGNYGDLLLVPFYGFRLDWAGFSYVMGIPFLLSVFAFFPKTEKGIKIINVSIAIFVWAMIVVSALIAAGEIVSYYEWQTKLSSKIWIHFTTPSEIFRTSSGSYTYWFLFYFFIQLIFAWFMYVKVFKKIRVQLISRPAGARLRDGVIYFMLGIGIFALGVRGGWQEIPVSATNAYHSEKRIVNDVTVNSVWNFIHMSYTASKVNLDEYFDNLSPEEAEQIQRELYAAAPCSDTTSVFTTNRPNVVLVTLEGWSAQLIESLGGEKNITPNFDALCDEGLLFTQIYSTGGTSETGHSSIISGYPTISGISISTESAKCRKLPSLNQSFEEKGYSTFYTFGGALSYGNIGGYLSDVGFDRLVDENDLDLEPTGQLGIHDEAMFPYFLSEIQAAKRPFFYGLFTQSTHSPYDMPVEPYDGYSGDGYVTSMNYADEHLGRFAEGIRQLPDFNNTIVIFIADHGKSNIFNPDTYDEKFFHIPLLIWGGALKPEQRGRRVDKIGSQADLAKTLLNQLDMDSESYRWSKDLLNPNTQEWAICTSTLSYGWKDSSGYTVYQMIEDHLIYSAYEDPGQRDEVLKKCRAVLECMYREFKEL